MSCIYKDKGSGRHCSKEGKEGQFCPGSGAFLKCYTPPELPHNIDSNIEHALTSDNYKAEIDQLKELLEKNPCSISIIPIDTIPDVEVVERPSYCKFCFNARVYRPTDEEMIDPFSTELTDDNDLSSCGVGQCYSKERRFTINSGNGKPVNIEFEEWSSKAERWITVGRYYPKFCPECGRRLDEYEEDKM